VSSYSQALNVARIIMGDAGTDTEKAWLGREVRCEEEVPPRGEGPGPFTRKKSPEIACFW